MGRSQVRCGCKVDSGEEQQDEEDDCNRVLCILNLDEVDCGQCGEEQQGALHILKDEGDGCNRLLWHILNLDEVGCGEEQHGVLYIQNLDEDDCNRVLCILNLDTVDCGEEQQAVHILNLDEVHRLWMAATGSAAHPKP